MTQIFIPLQLSIHSTLVQSTRRVIQTSQRHSLRGGSMPSLLARKEFPRHISKAFAFCLSDSIGVLRVETHFPVLVHDLRVKGENNVFLKNDVALRANGWILEHRGANAVAGKMPERETMFGESFRHGAMDMAGELTYAHELSCGFQRFRVSVRHRLRAPANFPANERAREFHPIAARAGDFQ